MRHRLRSALVWAVALSGFLAGCATARSELRVPTREAWMESLSSAVRDPDTWVPAAASIAVAVAGADEDISDWARDHTPLFGDEHRAETASNELKGATHILMFATALAPRERSDRWERLAVTIVEQEAIVGAVGGVTLLGKEAADRERPDASNRSSFPSGHASGSAATGALARENLPRSAIPPRWHPAVRIASRVLHGGTAWARIEAGKHYPTDVLAGSALGNLLAVTMDRAVRDGTEVEISLSPSREGFSFQARIRF